MNRIKELRLKNGMSQTQLADEIGVKNRQLISYFETEKRKPNLIIYKSLANFFNVSVEYIQGKCTYQDLDDIEKDIYCDMENAIAVVLAKNPCLTRKNREKILEALANDIQSGKCLMIQGDK